MGNFMRKPSSTYATPLTRALSAISQRNHGYTAAPPIKVAMLAPEAVRKFIRTAELGHKLSARSSLKFP